MKTCLVQQPSGLGDILLSIKIASMYSKQGYEVVWPVFPIYANLNKKINATGIDFINMEDQYQYKDVYEKLAFSKLNEVYEQENLLFLPIKNSFHSSWGKSMQRFDSHDASNMLAKFLMCNTTHVDWQDYFTINRDYEKENELFKLLNIEGDFHLVNDNFGTPPTWKEKLNKKVETPPHLQRVEMRFIKGFDVFDWMGVFEKASKIDTVSTSTFYLFEKQDLRCIPTIYSRNTGHRSHEENFGWLKKLANKEYEFIC
mgnify:CR=1 FL=1|tara:strand:- start:10997 stop:11767 length:771 start_codon:yes stop_codon:yes gene_type:complete